MSKKEEALEKAFPDGFSLQKDEHTFVVAGMRRESFSLDYRISYRRLPLQKMKRMSRRYHKSGGKRSESCILRKKSGWDYQKKGT